MLTRRQAREAQKRGREENESPAATLPPVITGLRSKRMRPQRQDQPPAGMAGLSATRRRPDTIEMTQEALVRGSLDRSPLEAKTRLMLAAELRKLAKKQQCDFDYLHSFRPNQKTSASDTSVFFAGVSLRGRPTTGNVAVKVSWATVDPVFNNSLIIEQLNYKHVVNNILAQHMSPHLLAYVASFVCPKSSLQRLPKDVQDNIALDLGCAKQWYIDMEGTSAEFDQRFGVAPNSVEFIMTELAWKPTALKEWLWPVEKLGKKPIATAKEPCIEDNRTTQTFPTPDKAGQLPNGMQILSVMFQILYTYEVFNRLHFRHNDGHLSNILIENWTTNPAMARAGPESPMAYTGYEVDGTHFLVPTLGNFVKIFDFDRSSLECDPNMVDPIVHGIIRDYSAELSQRTGASPGECVNTALLARKSDFMCTSYGQCGHWNPKYDLFLTFSLLHRLFSKIVETPGQLAGRGRSAGLIGDAHPYLVSYANEVRPLKEFIERHIMFDSVIGTYTDVPKDTKDNSHYLWTKAAASDVLVPDDLVSPVHQMLSDPIFRVFRVNPATVDVTQTHTYKLPPPALQPIV